MIQKIFTGKLATRYSNFKIFLNIFFLKNKILEHNFSHLNFLYIIYSIVNEFYNKIGNANYQFSPYQLNSFTTISRYKVYVT